MIKRKKVDKRRKMDISIVIIKVVLYLIASSFYITSIIFSMPDTDEILKGLSWGFLVILAFLGWVDILNLIKEEVK